MEFLQTFCANAWTIVLELAPWLLFGMLLAGIVHAVLPEGMIRRHLGGSRLANVFKAVLVGVPMPLCSCGVIPAALGLKRDGASDGAAAGFLISTPQTGVDSIFVSASFLGWPFALFKVAAAFISGLIGGCLVNLFNGATPAPASCCQHEDSQKTCCAQQTDCATPAPASSNATACSCGEKKRHHWHPKPATIKEIFEFAFVRLLRDVYFWLIVGVLVAALATTLVPANYLAQVEWTQGFLGMLVVLAVSIPMYVCSSGSVPMAAALVAIGMTPGAALVFLMAGPTTNVATIGATYRALGRRVLVIYLLTVIVLSLGAGLLFDRLLTAGDNDPHVHMGFLPHWLETATAVIMIALLLLYTVADIRAKLRPKPAEGTCCH